MEKTIVDKYEKIGRALMKMVIVMCIILIIAQGYLRSINRGLEPFLNKLYNDEGLSFKMIEIVQ